MGGCMTSPPLSMISEELLEDCLQSLQGQDFDEEEQAEKAEDFLREKTSLSGSSLENAVLDVLWRHRNRSLPGSSPPPPRHTVIRRSSPAPWQMGRSSTPLSPHSNLGTSPGSTSWLPNSRGGFSRPALSSTVSPFTSPRPSPRLALAQPIPHSPNLNAYEFSDQTQVSDFYGDFGSDSNVDWLVADDANSTTSSVGTLSAIGGLSATAAEFVPDMSPHDILRTVLGDKRTNDEIEAALEANSYDLALVANLSVTDGSHQGSTGPQFHVDSASEAFPPLQSTLGVGDQWAGQYIGKYPSHLSGLMGPKGVSQSMQLVTGKRNGSSTHGSRPHSRPGSRHQNRELNPAAPSVDDPDAFPTLAAVSAKNKKHHGKRGAHNREANSNKDSVPTSLADVVRMSPSPAVGKGKTTSRNKEGAKGRENSAAAQSIPPPQNIPWLETGSRANQQYIKYRTEAIRHGTGLEMHPDSSKLTVFISAAQAWNRNDARAAKALSLRGQAENEAMRKCHREAARQLYEERNKHIVNAGLDDSLEELYVDLHGLHPEEAIEYLEKILLKHANEGRRVVYAITGTGHHSKNGKDKIGKAVKAWLNEWKYLFREFSVPGERGGYVGGILGIDPTSYDRSLAKSLEDSADAKAGAGGNTPVLTMGKIQLLKREDLEVKH
ncbi:hypothetical protein APSETT445_008092 [Aspergillus pseudonomiae]